MQIRCLSCKMPISVGRPMVEQALNIIHEDNLVHYDFRCPKCKKTNKISKEQLLHAAPGYEYVPVEDKKKENEPAEKPKTKKK